MMATLKRLQQEAETVTEATNADSQPSASKKKRAREGRKLLMRFQTALNEGRIEDDIKGVKMEKVFSKASTKQAMIARVSLKRYWGRCDPDYSSSATSSLGVASQPFDALRQ